MPPNGEPRPASHFRLKLGGKESVGVFKEMSGLDAEIEVVEHKSVDEQGRSFTRKVAGNPKWSNIVLKRGVDATLDIYKWHDTVIKQGADAARVDGEVALLDIGGDTIARYSFKQGWPIKYVAATLDASTTNVALEEVHIAHEGFERVDA